MMPTEAESVMDERQLARNIDERGRFFILEKDGECGTETVIGLLLDGKRLFGQDALAICLRAGPHMVRNRELAALALEFPDLWSSIGSEVVISDPVKLERLQQFVAEFRLRKRRQRPRFAALLDEGKHSMCFSKKKSKEEIAADALTGLAAPKGLNIPTAVTKEIMTQTADQFRHAADELDKIAKAIDSGDAGRGR